MREAKGEGREKNVEGGREQGGQVRKAQVRVQKTLSRAKTLAYFPSHAAFPIHLRLQRSESCTTGHWMGGGMHICRAVTT